MTKITESIKTQIEDMLQNDYTDYLDSANCYVGTHAAEWIIADFNLPEEDADTIFEMVADFEETLFNNGLVNR